MQSRRVGIPDDYHGALFPGAQVGRYHILRRLARGGMAELFLARATGIENFEKLVVLKRILPEHAGQGRLVRLFLDEARLAATLHHNNIAQVFDIGKVGSTFFFAMEYVEGADVQRIWQVSADAGEPVPLAQALAIAIGTASGLHHAHELTDSSGRPRGIIHRDVSPSNVLVGHDGSVKLVDFGIARMNQDRDRTEPGVLRGKLAYMSPEQLRGEPLDRRSDIYSLGVLLFELTTGTQLFPGGREQVRTGCADDPPAPRPARPGSGYPAALERVVRRALDHDRDARQASARELQLELEAVARAQAFDLSATSLSLYLSRLLDRQSPPAMDPGPRTDADSVPMLGALNQESPAGPVQAEMASLFPRQTLALTGSFPTTCEPVWRRPFTRRTVVMAASAVTALLLAAGAYRMVGGRGEQARQNVAWVAGAIRTQRCGTERPLLSGIQNVDSLAIDREGTIYFSQSVGADGWIGRLRPGGSAVELRWVKVTGGPTIWGLAVDGERRRLYIAAEPVGGVQVIDLSAQPPRARRFLSQVAMVNDLAVDFDGNLFYSQQREKGVFRVTPEGLVSPVNRAPLTNAVGELITPAALAFAPNGDLFLGNFGSTIVRLSLEGGREMARHTFGKTYPWGNGLAFDVRGRLYVSDYWPGERSILRFEPDGSKWTVAGSGTHLSSLVFGRGALDCRDLYVASPAGPLRRLPTDAAGLPLP
jgi:serine/threonine protein kinase/streptogramin lyase